MVPFTQELHYGLERQEQLRAEPVREHVNLSDGLRFSAAREALHRAIDQFWQSMVREGELCLQIEPACETQFV